MLGAMVESVSERGYEATSVACVIGLAGVSRRAFYEQFANKEECALCAHDVVVAHARKHVLEAWASEHGWANRLRAACKALLDAAADSPKGARLVLVASPALGARGRERTQLADFSFERLLADALRTAPEEVGLPRLTSRAIVGGVRNVLFVRMLERREHELYTLSDPLLDWIESYRPASVALLDGLGAAGSRSPTPFTAAEERGRGQHCSQAALERLFAEALAAAGSPLGDAHPWPEGVRLAIVAFLARLLAEEHLLRVASVEQLGAGPGLPGELTRAIEGLVELVLAGAPEPRHGAEVARQAITGALWALVTNSLPEGGLARTPELAHHLAFTVLAPYLGADLALAAIRSSGAAPDAS
jgi:AcrR family transcriptional regulator